MLSSAQPSMPQLRRMSPSIPNAPNSFTITAIRRPRALASRCRTNVVFPAPRKPVTMVAGSLDSARLMVPNTQRMRPAVAPGPEPSCLRLGAAVRTWRRTPYRGAETCRECGARVRGTPPGTGRHSATAGLLARGSGADRLPSRLAPYRSEPVGMQATALRLQLRGQLRPRGIAPHRIPFSSSGWKNRLGSFTDSANPMSIVASLRPRARR